MDPKDVREIIREQMEMQGVTDAEMEADMAWQSKTFAKRLEADMRLSTLCLILGRLGLVVGLPDSSLAGTNISDFPLDTGRGGGTLDTVEDDEAE